METRRKFFSASGLINGFLAGMAFALAQQIGAYFTNTSPEAPWRMFATVILGEGGLIETPPGVAVLAGFLTHFSLAALFGCAYGYLVANAPSRVRLSYFRQSVLGSVFGTGLYLVNFQMIARHGYPWFLQGNQPGQLFAHTFFYGFPLGALFAFSSRREAGKAMSGDLRIAA